MRAEISKTFRFEAAHRLPNVRDGHKCGRLHGHSYSFTISLCGEIGNVTGWVRDFADLATAAKPIIDALDHRYLNELAGLENPTSENLAVWILRRIDLVGEITIEVHETCTTSCRVTEIR